MEADTDNWINAQVGMSLELGDKVKSSDDSNAEITFFDGSTIELQAGTQIEVAALDIATDTGSTTIRLKQEIGNTISRVTNLADPASRYEVETPAGVGAVRGSVMLVDVRSSGLTYITSKEGDIRAIAQGITLRIPEGRKCIIRPGQRPRLVSRGGFGGGGSRPSNNPPDAVDDSTTTPEDTPVIIDVLANDTDIDGDTLVIDSVTKGASGSVTNNGSNVTYTPNPDFNGTDSFTYTISDGNGGTDTATVNVTISPANDPPDAVDDSATTPEDTPVIIDVLANDTDIDGDTLAVDSVTKGASGSVTNNGSDVTYTPNPDFNGTDSFTYTISDGNGGTDTATVNVTVLGRVTMTLISDTNTIVTYSSSGYASPGDPAMLAWVPSNWWPDLTYSFPNGAQWIWESERTQNPVSGDIVDFERTLTIPGSPVSGTIYITCDNGYEVYLNDQLVGSAQLGSNWRTSDLTESYVSSSGWESVESWDITAFIQYGLNSFEIGTANEYMGPLDGQDTGTQDANPAGLIFEIIITYVAESEGTE